MPYDGHIDQRTIDRFLADGRFAGTNRIAGRKVDANIAVLKRDVGLADADIVRIPSLFTARSMGYGLLWSAILGMDPGRERTAAEVRLAAMRRGVAEIAGPVNGLVLNCGEYVVPKPYGPEADGKDLFAVAISTAFRTTGCSVRYADDLISPHVPEGESHWATDTLRAVLAPGQRRWLNTRWSGQS